eukprot:TRINITY_DN2020_c0_g1_i1.p1 TRINITY_DN2020_c0_g1~~TRINITY_DN2020_c0_g1_i1.p1  ORF type:complete len:168 (+),score=23.10 TRINITY_DN2020_c0_g1_i1:187-690(+)
MSAAASQAVPPKREFHEASWELLQIELIDWIYKSDDESLDSLKLERIGFSVGQRLAERYTKERTRFSEHLEMIKFLCKEFWLELYKKQIDNLRTNHRGVFVLHDNKFRWLLKLSSASSAQTKAAAMRYLVFPCGLIRGALANLGVSAEVVAEITALPSCNFTIRIKQ